MEGEAGGAGEVDVVGEGRRVRLVGAAAIPNQPASPPVRFFLIVEGKKAARSVCWRRAGRCEPTASRLKPFTRPMETRRRRGGGSRQRQSQGSPWRDRRDNGTTATRRTGKRLARPFFRFPRLVQGKGRKRAALMALRPHHHAKGFICNGCKEWHPKDMMHCELV